MGGGKGASPPAAPNYQSLIGQQGQVGFGGFENQLYAGRPNQYNPYGYTQWTPPPLPVPATGGGYTDVSGTNPSGLPGPHPVRGAAGPGMLGGPMGIMTRQNPPSTGTPTNTGYGGAIPTPTGQWTQQSGFSGPIGGIVGSSEAGALAAGNTFNPANNPTWQGPSPGATADMSWQGPNPGTAAGINYGGPTSAGALAFNPANTAKSLYTGAESLLEPGFQTQSNALDQSLKAMGYDVTGPGGAQTAENNLNTNQNMVRSQLAGWAEGQAIPQGAQALQAQESIPQVQQNIALGAESGQLAPLTAAGGLATQQLGSNVGAQTAAANIGSQQFGAGVTGAQLPISEEAGMLSNALAPSSTLPGGAAQTPALPGVDVLGAGQQNFANQASLYNAQQAAAAQQQSGLFGLGGAGLLALALSDPKAKKDVEVLEGGRKPRFHAFHYKGEDSGSPRHVGFMADEVEDVEPRAVKEIGGMKHVFLARALKAKYGRH